MSVDAPERIFLAPNTDHINPWVRPLTTHDFDEDGTEYIRADKLEELAAENDRLRIKKQHWTVRAEKANATLAEKDKEIAAATVYAETLAVALHSQHYAENTSWRPLSGDLTGLLTQIDNMTAGLARNAGGKNA